jgi:hypothetical protein
MATTGMCSRLRRFRFEGNTRLRRHRVAIVGGEHRIGYNHCVKCYYIMTKHYHLLSLWPLLKFSLVSVRDIYCTPLLPALK